MSLINIDTALRQVILKFKKLAPGEGIEVSSYKRNRSVYVMRTGNGQAIVRQRGYEEREFTVPEGGLEGALKPIFRHEFPRSRKLRLYALSAASDLSIKRKQL